MSASQSRLDDTISDIPTDWLTCQLTGGKRFSSHLFVSLWNEVHKVDNKFHRETIISFSVALSSILYHNGNTVTADTRPSGLVCYLPAKGSFSCSVSFLRGKHVTWRFLPWTTRAMLDCPCTMSSYWALLVSLLHLWLDMRKMLPLLSPLYSFYSVRL